MAEALKESQTRLRLATKSAEIGIVETDLASGEVLWDDTCAKIHGFPPERPMRLQEYETDLVHPEDQAPFRTSLAEALTSASGHWGREYRIVRPGGEVRWITEDHFILRDAAGKAVRMIGAKQDVTARNRTEEQIKQTLAEKETLLREIHHRVKNNLNTISNLIYFQAKLLTDADAVAAFRDSQNRIQSMARIHEHLYRSWDLSTVDMKAYLSDLVIELAQTYGVKNARIDLVCEGIALDIDLAVPCGLIMNELISNALKYAFALDAPDNRIGICLTKAQNDFTLEVADNGRGLPANWDTDSERTLGLRLVTMFCKQLGGTLAVHNAPAGGAVFRIDFPGAGKGHDS
jgi:PAS domain S-box-containing protein